MPLSLRGCFNNSQRRADIIKKGAAKQRAMFSFALRWGRVLGINLIKGAIYVLFVLKKNEKKEKFSCGGGFSSQLAAAAETQKG